MDCSKNGRWKSSFKKFRRVRVNAQKFLHGRLAILKYFILICFNILLFEFLFGKKLTQSMYVKQNMLNIDEVCVLIFQMACYHSNLHDVVHKLWSWCQLDYNLMMCVLSLLTSYTASCPTGNQISFLPLWPGFDPREILW